MASSFLIKEALRPPVDMVSLLTKGWAEEMELRTRRLARMERVWSKSGGTGGGAGSGLGTGEERERIAFCDALRDGYVLTA